MRKRALLVALPTVVLLSLPAMAAEPAGRCDRHRPALRKTASLLVFVVWTRQKDEVGARIGDVNVCARPSGGAVRLTTATTYSGYPPNQNLQELRLAGDYAGALVVVGEASAYACAMVQTDCPVPFARLSFAAARERRSLTLYPSSHQASHLTLSSAGAAAWLEPAGSGSVNLVAGRLAPQGAHRLSLATSQLDTGSIGDLHWDGLTLTWRNGGQQRSAAVT